MFQAKEPATFYSLRQSHNVGSDFGSLSSSFLFCYEGFHCESNIQEAYYHVAYLRVLKTILPEQSAISTLHDVAYPTTNSKEVKCEGSYCS